MQIIQKMQEKMEKLKYENNKLQQKNDEIVAKNRFLTLVSKNIFISLK